MTAITVAKKSTDRQNGDVLSFKQAAVTIPEGAIVSVNAAGYATNGSDAANDVFVGIAEKQSITRLVQRETNRSRYAVQVCTLSCFLVQQQSQTLTLFVTSQTTKPLLLQLQQLTMFSSDVLLSS